MKIKEITYQHRRDFKAVYECEGCGFEQPGGGYDDDNFHRNVIPNMRCQACDQSSRTLGANYRPLTTKYPEGFQI